MINNDDSNKEQVLHMNQRNKDLLQAIIDYSRAVIYVKDIYGEYILVNKLYEEIFELEKDEVIGKTDFDIFSPDIANRFIVNDQLVMESKTSMMFEETTVYNGVERSYITNKFPYYNSKGELEGVCGISTDITERLEALRAIEFREANYRTLVSNIQGVVYRCSTTADWKMHFMSEYIYNLTGYPASDFIMNSVRTFASIIHPEDRYKVEKKVYDGLNRKETYFIQYRIMHKDGTIRWVHEKGCGYYTKGEKNAKWLDGVIVDITPQVQLTEALSTQNEMLIKEIEKRKIYEKGLHDLKEELEIRIVERTKSIEEANIRLQETLDKLKKTQEQVVENRKMSAIGSLVKGICHEISSPLGASLTISTYIQDALKEINNLFTTHTISEEELVARLSEISDAVVSEVDYIGKGIQIIDKLRLISSDRAEHNFLPLKLKPLLESVLKDVEKLKGNKNIEVKLTCREDVVIESSAELIKQVMKILLINSLYHGFEDRDRGVLTIVVKGYDDEVIITYSDNGKGIEKEDLTRIFDPFFTTRMGAMSGLDLYALHVIVTQKLMGGVSCQSPTNQGAQFIIKLPNTIG